MTSIFVQLRKSQNVLNFCSHLFENQLRYIYIYIDSQSWIIWLKTFIATQSFMLLAKQSSGNCQK